MKNLSWILNILLLLLVGNLYWKTYKSNPNSTSTVVPAPKVEIKKDSTGKETTSLAPNSIVYVNTDSILEKYNLLNVQKKSLEKKFNDVDMSLKSRGKKLQEQYLALEEKAQKGTTPPAQLQAEGQQIALQQQSLEQEQAQKSKQLMDEENKINEQLQKKVKEVLKRLKAEMGFDYAVSYSLASPFLLVEEQNNITQRVIQELNKK
jgi:outer membrane protein